MWTCPTCGEPHEDHFKICWKCAANEPPAPTPTAPPVERKLRSFGSVLVRAVVAFVIGTIGGMAVFHRSGATLEEAAVSGVVAGAVLGVAVGVYIWVVFPYATTTADASPKS